MAGGIPNPNDPNDPNSDANIPPGYMRDDAGNIVPRPTNPDGGPTTVNQISEQDAKAEQARELARRAAEAEKARRNAYNYGGREGGAHEAAERYKDTAVWAQGRGPQTINTGMVDRARDWNTGARQQQVNMAQLMANRASGRTPSISGMMADRQMRQAAAEQSSAAASARGPAGLALAQQGASANTAAMQSNISNQAQINAAQERLQAEQAASGAYGAMRAGDAQMFGLDANISTEQAKINAANAEANDRYAMGMTGFEIDVNKTQMQGQGNREAAEHGYYFNNRAANAADRANSNAEDAAWIAAGAGGLVASVPIVTGLLGSDKTAPPAGDINTHAPAQGGGGYDPETGAPVPSGGGGFEPPDPNDPDSDERAKVPVTWGAVQAGAPAAPSKTVDMSKMLAKRALEEKDIRDQGEAKLRHAESMQEGRGSTGFAAVDGVGALKRRDQEDYGLLKAKERNHVELSQKEEDSRDSLRHRVGRDEADKRREAIAAGEPRSHAKEYAQVGAAAIGAVGQALGGRRPVSSYHYQPAQQQQITSDMTTKDAAPLPPMTPQQAAQLEQGNAMLGQQQAQQAAAMSFGPSVGRRGGITSDDRTKLAAAWDQGHAAGIANVEKASRWSPEEIKKYSEGDGYKPEAATVRSIKTRAYDEGFNQPRGPQPTDETPMAASNRALAAEPYQYKPGWAERNGQAPGETNVGPMAQTMAADPVAGTAVKTDPDTGTLQLDRDKLAKVTAGGVADLQSQVDVLKRSLMARRMAGMGRRR